MATGVEFPAFLSLRYRRDGTSEADARADAQRMLAGARREFADFADETQRTLNQALSIPRNAGGSLDLGVEELRAAAAAQDARAIAARELADAQLQLAQAEGFVNQESRQLLTAYKALATQEEGRAANLFKQVQAEEALQEVLNRQASATDAIVAANQRGTNAQQSVINSTRASRVAYIQLGQQMQDIVIQSQLGTNAFQIFSQQIPQAAFALSGLEKSADATQKRIGQFATFLSGPFGAAIFASTAIIGPLIANFISAQLAADEAADSIAKLTDEKRKSAVETRNAEAAEDAYRQTIEGVTEAIRENQRALEDLNAVRETAAEKALGEAQANLANAVALQFETQQRLLSAQAFLQAQVARATGSGQGADLAALNLEARGDAVEALAERFAEGASRIGEAQQAITRAQAGVSVEQGQAGEEGAINRRYDALVDGAREAAIASGQTGAALREEVAAIEAARDAELERVNARGRTRSPGRSRLSDEQREYERAKKASEDYILSLEREIEAIGKTEEELRRAEVSRQAEAAVTKELADEIRELGEARERGLSAQAETDRYQEAQEAVRGILQDSERRLEIETLILAGRDAEALALQEIWRLEDQIGELTQAQRDEIYDIVEAEERRLEVMGRLFEQQSAYLDATRDIRNELESFFAGEGADFEQIARRLQARLTVDRIFGDALDELEDEIRSDYDVKVDYLETNTQRAGDAALNFAEAVNAAALGIATSDEIAAATSGGSIVGAANDNEIVVEGVAPQPGSLGGETIEGFFDLVGRRLVEPLLVGLDDILGTKLAGELGDVLGGGVSGYLQAGPVGGVLGALKGLFPDSQFLGDAFKGAAQGQQIAGLADSLGIGFSNSGASLGGAVGSFLPIPGGEIIGSIAGGIIGKLIGGSDRGSAIISGGRVSGFYGDTDEFKQAAGGLAGNVLESIERIAESLGATYNSAAGRVSIGIRDGDYFVDPQGRGYTKQSKFGDILGFGEDSEAAVRAAILNLIEDGVIQGLSAAENRLLRQGGDLEKALQDVLDFRDVFDRLRRYKDPLGAALDDLDNEFSRLEGLFDRAGASAEQYAELEELYGIERANAIREATESVTGSLRSLLDDLLVGDTGLSLRDRQANAIEDYDALAARVQAGDTTAFDDFSDAARTLLEIERELFGSQQGYFDRFNEVRDISQSALDQQQALIDQANGRDNPFDAPHIADAVNRQSDFLGAKFDRNYELMVAQNDNLISLLREFQTRGGGQGGGASRDLYLRDRQIQF